MLMRHGWLVAAGFTAEQSHIGGAPIMAPPYFSLVSRLHRREVGVDQLPLAVRLHIDPRRLCQ